MDVLQTTFLRNYYHLNTASFMIQDLGCLIAFLFHVLTVGSECSFIMLSNCGTILAIMNLFIPLL